MLIDHDDTSPEACRIQVGCSERLAWLTETALDTMKAHRELPSTYFQWCGKDGNRIQMFRIPFGADEERAPRNEILKLICLANNLVYLGMFAEAWAAPNNGPLRASQSDQRKEVIIIDIVARVADQGVITLCRMHDILRAADGSISFEPGDTGAGHIGDYVVDAMGALLLSSRAERRAATKELRRAAKLGKLIKGPRPPWAEQ